MRSNVLDLGRLVSALVPVSVEIALWAVVWGVLIRGTLERHETLAAGRGA